MDFSFLAIGDPHFKVTNLPKMRLYTKRILGIVEEREPDLIVVLGDVLHTFDKINSYVLSEAIEWLKQLATKAPLFLIIGNHDRPNAADFMSNVHPFTALSEWENVEVFDQAKMAKIGNYKFVGVPYVPPGRFVEALDNVKDWKMADCIFAHQEFRGAKMKYIISEHGDEWPPELPFVVSGHIHSWQKINKNIVYVGTGMQHEFDEKDNKSISMFTKIENGWEEERIWLNLPTKEQFEISVDDLGSWHIPQDAADEIKIIIRGSPSEIIAAAHLPQIKAWRSANHIVQFKAINDGFVEICSPSERKNFLDNLKLRLKPNSAPMKEYVKIFES